MFKILILFLLSASAQAGAPSMNVTTQAAITATTTSTLALPANPKRHYLVIQNNGTAAVSITFNTAQTGAEGIVIPPSGNYETGTAPTNAVYVKAASGTQPVVIVSGN